MMNKAIFIDLDGTLVNSSSSTTVSLENTVALMEAQKKGYYIVLCTGRSKSNLIKIWKQINFTKFSDYAIYLSGAVIENLRTNKVIYNNKISKSSGVQLVDFLMKRNKLITVADNNYLYVSNIGLTVKLLKKFYKVESKKYSDLKLTSYSLRKVGVFTSLKKRKVKTFRTLLENKFEDINFTITGGDYYIEATNKKVNKGVAAILLAKELNIDLSISYVFGDSGNDISIFKYVGTPIAMRNSTKELIKYSNYISIYDNKESGVGKEIMKLILNY